MTVLSVIYPKNSGTFFDLDYYMHKHVPMVRTLLGSMGLKEFRLLRGTELPAGGDAAYEMIATLTFASPIECRDALGEHGDQIVDDITNFTDMKPVLQLNEQTEV